MGDIRSMGKIDTRPNMQCKNSLNSITLDAIHVSPHFSALSRKQGVKKFLVSQTQDVGIIVITTISDYYTTCQKPKDFIYMNIKVIT